MGHFYGKKWGCSSDSLRYHRKHSALLHLSRDRGGICWVAKALHSPSIFGELVTPDLHLHLHPRIALELISGCSGSFCRCYT